VLTVELRFGLADLVVRIASHNQTIAGQLQRCFAAYGARAALHRAADISIDLELGPLAEHPDNGQWVEVPAFGFFVRQREGSVEIKSRQVHLRIHPHHGSAQGVVTPEFGAEDHLQMSVVSYALLTLLRYRDLYPMHGAALTLDGRGLLVVADSGSGKSTLAALLLSCGWSFVGDDSLLLQPQRAGVEAVALRNDLYLAPDAPCAQDAGENASWSGTGKVRVTVARHAPGKVVTRCLPRAVVFPRIVKRRNSTLTPCPADEALHLLAHHGLVAEMERDRAAANMHVLRDLVAQCAYAKLEAGLDVLDEPNRVAELLGLLCNNGAEEAESMRHRLIPEEEGEGGDKSS